MVTGMTSNMAMPTGFDEGKKWINDLVRAVLNEIVPESSDKIQFVNSGRSFRGEVPVCEIKMKEKVWADKIRKEYSFRTKHQKNGCQFPAAIIF